MQQRAWNPETLVREYVQSLRPTLVLGAPPRFPTLAELAAELGLGSPACRGAIERLHSRGEIIVLLHPGGRYELRLASSHRS